MLRVRCLTAEQAKGLKRNNITVCATTADLYKQVADHIAALARRAIRDHAAFHIALAGGSTPRHLYTTLAGEPYARDIDWSSVHVYFGDERHVPPDHEDSNFSMASQAMLQHVPIPAGQIHRMRGELDEADEIARQYALEIESSLPRDEQNRPVLDLALLGLGPDGHIASLFPQTDILDNREQSVAAVYVDRLSTWRISMTYPTLENARAIYMLVAGHNKADILREIFHGHGGAPYPVERLRPTGKLCWFLDNAASDDIEHDA